MKFDNAPQRCIEHRKIGEERHKFAERHFVADDIATADVPHDQPAKAEHKLHGGRVASVCVFDPQTPVAQVVGSRFEAVVFRAFLRERLDDAHSMQHAVEHGHLLR